MLMYKLPRIFGKLAVIGRTTTLVILLVAAGSAKLGAFGVSQQQPATQGLQRTAPVLKLPHALQKQPNIVIIICDDAAYGDFGFNHAKDLRTPNLDRLAASGATFNNFYTAAAACSPSRAGLMSGQYVSRFGYDFNPPKPKKWQGGLNRITLASRLQALGYTTAAFGKWHLGNRPCYHPNRQGFDYFWGFIAGNRPYFAEHKFPDWKQQRIQRGGRYEMLQGYLTEQVGAEVARYVASADFSHPQLLWIAFNAPHSPWQAPQHLLDKFAHIKNPQRRNIAAMQWALDTAVGQITGALNARKQRGNTLIWFLSDNGGAEYAGHDNSGLNGHKGLLLEGGIKTAAFACWPGHIKRGQHLQQALSAYDITATSLALAGGSIPAEFAGCDIFSTLNSGKNHIPSRYLYWRQGDFAAIRDGRYKLILYLGEALSLFDLSRDPKEQNDLLRKPTEYLLQRAASMQKAWRQWNSYNTPNKWQPEKDRQEQQRQLDLYYPPRQR